MDLYTLSSLACLAVVSGAAFATGWACGRDAGGEEYWPVLSRQGEMLEELRQSLADKTAPEHEDGGGI